MLDGKAVLSVLVLFGLLGCRTTFDGDDGPDGPDPANAVCGNGVLEADEQCDGDQGCTDCMLDAYECQPLNNAGCAEGTKCSFTGTTNLEFSCVPFDRDPPLGWGDPGCFSASTGVRDQSCDVGLACVTDAQTSRCDGQGGCCTLFCDLSDPDFDCRAAGDTCQPIWDDTAPAGLEDLGFCGA